MADLVRATEPAIRDETFKTALESAGPYAMALALACYARNRDKNLYYFTYQRNSWKYDWQGTWGTAVWIRPHRPAPELRRNGPTDVLQSYNGSWRQS